MSKNGKAKTKVRKRAIVLLDETGSMAGQETRVVTSMNEYAAGLPKGTRLAVFKFDSLHYTKFFSGRVKKWPGMSEGDYRPGAMTPLYDSIAKTIEYARSKASKGDRVMVMVDTDGLENASSDYDENRCKKLIAKCKKDGWEFLFMSTGIDEAAAVKVGATGQSLSMNTMSAGYGSRTALYASATKLTSDYLVKGTRRDVGLTVVADEKDARA